MPYSVSVKEGFVLVRHEGEVTLEEAEAAAKTTLRLSMINRLSRVFVDMRDLTGDADPADLRTFMEGNAEVTPPRPHAAILVREDQYPKFRFFEDFAVSRGMPIRVFTDEEEATNWLVD